MSEKLEPGHFYLVKSSSGAVSYCLYIDFKGKVLGFEYSSEDEGYEFDADANFRISEDLAMRAQEIPAPQIVWVNSRMNPFSDKIKGIVFSLTLFTGDVPNKFWDRIYSLADVQWRLQHKHYEITLQGIGTFQMTSKGASCFSSNFSEGLHVLCQDFFQPEWLLPEFGITSDGVERFLKEGWFRSWKELTVNPGYYECNGTIIPIPSEPKSYLNDMLLPCFRFDDESGCYVYDKITFLSPCNLLEYRKDMYVGIQVTLNGISGLPRGSFVLSQTFRSCQSISEDKVFWTLDDLLEELNDILGKDSQLDLPGLQITFAAEDGRVHMQSFNKTFWDDTPWIRDTFLAQR